MTKNLPLDIISSPERVILDLRKAGFKEVMVIGKYNYNQTHKQLPAHTHRHMLEICFCSKGEQVYEVNEKLYKIKGGDLFVTYPGEWHGTGKYPEEKGELYWIIIKMDAAIRSKKFLHFEHKLAKEWIDQLLHLPRHFKGNGVLKQKLENIFSLYTKRKDVFSFINLQHQVADCLLEIINFSKKNVPKKGSARLQLIDEYIKTHMDEPVMLEKLAKLAGLSLSHFKSWFKEETGTTPLDYVMRHKIRKAQELLEKNQMSITSIAFETGFQNSQYFASVFRKFTGESPSSYRMRRSD
jgi:AraC-like DNA-binding protein